MKNNLKFEWRKLIKSRYWLVAVLVFLILTLVFYYAHFSEQREAKREQDHQYEELLRHQKSTINVLKDNIRRASPPLSDELRIELEYAEHLLPYIENIVKNYQQQDYIRYYEAEMAYLPELTKREFFLYANPENLSVEEIEPNFDGDASRRYEALETFKQTDEPMELEKASTAPLNFLINFTKFLQHPLVLTFLVLATSVVFIEEVVGESYSLMVVENKRFKHWVRAGNVVNYTMFTLGLFLLFTVSYIILHPFGEPLFGVAPSFQAPVTFRNEIVPNISLGLYLFIGVVVLIFLYIFFHKIYRRLLVKLKEPIFSVVLLLLITVGGYYITDYFPILKQWLNPLNLFYWQEMVMRDNGYISLLLNIVVLLFFIQILSIPTKNGRVRKVLKAK